MALGQDLVRHVLTTKQSWVEVLDEGPSIRIRDGEGGETRSFGHDKALPVEALDRAMLSYGDVAATTEIDRKAGLRQLRHGGCHRQLICRLRLGPEGLVLETGPGGREAETVITTAAECKVGKPTVFGLRGEHLADAFRTLRGKTLWLALRTFDRPVQLHSEGHDERMTLGTARI